MSLCKQKPFSSQLLPVYLCLTFSSFTASSLTPSLFLCLFLPSLILYIKSNHPYFIWLYPVSHSFSHNFCLMTTAKGWNVDRLVEWASHFGFFTRPLLESRLQLLLSVSPAITWEPGRASLFIQQHSHTNNYQQFLLFSGFPQLKKKETQPGVVLVQEPRVQQRPISHILLVTQIYALDQNQ